MASVIDSIRTVFTENFALLKLGAFSGATFMLFQMFVSDPKNISTYTFFSIVMGLFYIGYTAIIMHNRIHQKLELLPIVNPMLFLNVSLKGLAVLIPYLIIGIPVVNSIFGLFNFEGVPQMIAIAIIQLLFLAMGLTALMYYSNNYEIADGYGLSKVLTGFQDILVYMVACLIVILIVNAFTIVPILYFANQYWGIGPAVYFIIIYAVTMDIAIMADYCGQLWFDLDSKNSYYS